MDVELPPLFLRDPKSAEVGDVVFVAKKNNTNHTIDDFVVSTILQTDAVKMEIKTKTATVSFSDVIAFVPAKAAVAKQSSNKGKTTLETVSELITALLPAINTVQDLTLEDVIVDDEVKEQGQAQDEEEEAPLGAVGDVVWVEASPFGLLPVTVMGKLKDRLVVVPVDAAHLDNWSLDSLKVLPSHVHPFAISSVPKRVWGRFKMNFASMPWRAKFMWCNAYKAATASSSSKSSSGDSLTSILAASWKSVSFLVIFTCLVVYLGVSAENYAAVEGAGGKTVDYYAVLGVPRNAGDAEIKRAFKQMTRKWHPDMNRGCGEECASKMSEIQEAYKTLSYPATRAYHDLHGVSPPDALYKKEKSRHGNSKRSKK
eukprot:PhM_4_TR17612/c0_g1_i1/m.85324